MKLFENVEIKNVITIVGLLLWVAFSVYGFLNGEFTTVFDYFKEVFMMIVSFYLGTKVASTTETTETTESTESVNEVDGKE